MWVCWYLVRICPLRSPAVSTNRCLFRFACRGIHAITPCQHAAYTSSCSTSKSKNNNSSHFNPDRNLHRASQQLTQGDLVALWLTYQSIGLSVPNDSSLRHGLHQLRHENGPPYEPSYTFVFDRLARRLRAGDYAELFACPGCSPFSKLHTFRGLGSSPHHGVWVSTIRTKRPQSGYPEKIRNQILVCIRVATRLQICTG